MCAAVNATGRQVLPVSKDVALKKGYFSTLRILSHTRDEKRQLQDASVLCAAAAAHGDLKELQALRREGFSWTALTCEHAAENGHLEILKWARANGCPWDLWTCVYAAKGGHIEVLRWARENGAPWTEDIRRFAASKGYVEA